MEVDGWTGDGEDGRVKLRKGCRKKKCKARYGGNAPAPLSQTKLPTWVVLRGFPLVLS